MNLKLDINANEILSSLGYFFPMALLILLAMFLFSIITKYKDLEQIQQGNMAVAVVYLGKVLGLVLIMQASAGHNDSLLNTLVWAAIGFIGQLIGYVLYEFGTKKFKVDEEIEKGNMAVAIQSATISLGLSMLVAISIT